MALRIVKPILCDESNNVVTENQSYAFSSRVEHWESVMVILSDCILNVRNCVNTLKGDDISGHDVFSNDLLAGSWNLIDVNWHLLSSAGSLVKRSCEKGSDLI